MRKVLRIIGLIVAVQILAAIVGQVLSRRWTKGDENSDQFRLAALFGGKEFSSHATKLQSGSAMTAMGGIEIDLRDATLAEEGAYLDLAATMGGIRVVVPAGWAVDVDGEAKAGAFQARVTPRAELPEDAPRLNVHAVARMGGVLVTTED